MIETEAPQIYALEGQPARKVTDAPAGVFYEIQVYLGGGRWKPIDDPTGSFAYASPLSDERAKALIAEWDENPVLFKAQRFDGQERCPDGTWMPEDGN